MAATGALDAGLAILFVDRKADRWWKVEKERAAVAQMLTGCFDAVPLGADRMAAETLWSSGEDVLGE